MEQTKTPIESTEVSDAQNRREVVRKLGRFAAYAAPFTIMAMSAKAASGSGPGPHAAPAAAGRPH